MFQVTIDNLPYSTHATEAEADAVRARLRRWASNSTRIAVVPAPAACPACRGTGVATRLVWVGARGGWVSAPGPCRLCDGSGAAPATADPAAA